jgi:hypothetical protein
VLNSAIASAATPVNQAAAVHTSCAPLSSAAAATHRHCVQTPQGRTKTSRGRANSSCTRQMPRSCLIRQLQRRHTCESGGTKIRRPLPGNASNVAPRGRLRHWSFGKQIAPRQCGRSSTPRAGSHPCEVIPKPDACAVHGVRMDGARSANLAPKPCRRGHKLRLVWRGNVEA